MFNFFFQRKSHSICMWTPLHMHVYSLILRLAGLNNIDRVSNTSKEYHKIPLRSANFVLLPCCAFFLCFIILVPKFCLVFFMRSMTALSVVSFHLGCKFCKWFHRRVSMYTHTIVKVFGDGICWPIVQYSQPCTPSHACNILFALLLMFCVIPHFIFFIFTTM